MSALTRRLTNSVARVLRATRRRFFPRFDTRKSPLARVYLRWASSAARLDYVDGVVGHRMYLDERDSLRLSVARLYEPVATRLFQAEIRAGQTVVDLGANIGYFTLLFARQVGATGRVVSFEPDPTNFALLEKNVALNGYSNVTPVRSAVWSRSGPLHLHLNEENRGDHRVYETADERRFVTIDAVRLDDYFAESIPAVDWIKMDIQGSEYHAVLGMPRLLARSPGLTIVTEFWPAAIARAGGAPEAFLSALSDNGFTFQLVDERHDRLEAIDLQQLLERYTPENDESADLVCRRR